MRIAETSAPTSDTPLSPEDVQRPDFWDILCNAPGTRPTDHQWNDFEQLMRNDVTGKLQKMKLYAMRTGQLINFYPVVHRVIQNPDAMMSFLENDMETLELIWNANFPNQFHAARLDVADAQQRIYNDIDLQNILNRIMTENAETRRMEDQLIAVHRRRRDGPGQMIRIAPDPGVVLYDKSPHLRDIPMSRWEELRAKYGDRDIPRDTQEVDKEEQAEEEKKEEKKKE